MLRYFRTHLALKLFFSYMVVTLIGGLAMIAASNFSIPEAYNRHMGGMGMGGMMPGNTMMGPGSGYTRGNEGSPGLDLFASYRSATNEAFSLAAIASLCAAILASIFISRQVVGPVQKMRSISHHIASGNYEERLKISGDMRGNQLDELDQLALSFNQMVEKLEKTETMRSQLIGDVSHELRTPLTAIKGYMEGLVDGVIPPTPETFQQVYMEADRLQKLVNDLQELSRVEAGAYTLHLMPVKIEEIIAPVNNHFNRQFADKGVSLVVDVPAGLPKAAADEDRITQVLTNIIGNALQYTQPGGEVTINASANKNEMEITVSDNGIGIKPEHLGHVFDRFFRADKSRARSSGGSGIGLSIARSLVFAHHGRIWVESQGEGKGAVFHFTLPLWQQSPGKNV